MNEYQPYDEAEGDPWSTEPVQEQARGRRHYPAETQGDDNTEVLARMPDLEEHGRPESQPHYRRRSSSRGGRRGSSRSSAIPTPVWAIGGLLLLGIALVPFFLKGNNGGETALQEPSVWQPEMPAPNAPLAPAWTPGIADSQRQQSSGWTHEAGFPATISPEPGTPGTWTVAPPTADWVGAPAGIPYGGNAADVSDQGSPSGWNQAQPPLISDVATQPAPPAWGGTAAPYRSIPADASGHHPGSPQPDMPGASAAYGTGTGSYRQNQPGSQPPQWDHSGMSPPMATPAPEALSPGYGNYQAAPPHADYRTSPTVGGDPGAYGQTQPSGYLPQPGGYQPSVTVNPYTTSMPNQTGGGGSMAGPPFNQSADPAMSMAPFGDAAMARREPYSPGTLAPGMTPAPHESWNTSQVDSRYNMPPNMPPANPTAPDLPNYSMPGTNPMAPVYPADPNPGAPVYPGYPNSAAPVHPGYPNSAAPAYPGYPNSAAPAYPMYPESAAPAYPATYPSTQPGAAMPAGQSQPYYGSGAAASPQPSAARLSGVIQEPTTTRAAYDDRARPSFY